MQRLSLLHVLALTLAAAEQAPNYAAPNPDLNRRAELARAVVEHQFGRIGTAWRIASDDAGPWRRVGNGGHFRHGSAGGMARSVQYFEVCARLTALTQRMRDAYPRDGDKFFRGEHEDWEIAFSLQRLQQAQLARA